MPATTRKASTSLIMSMWAAWSFKAQYQAQSLEYLLALLNSRLLRWYFPFD